MPLAVQTGKDRYRISSPLVINHKDGSLLVEIPAGEFEMGDGYDSVCPKHRVYVNRYFIGVYAVTNRQYRQFVDETGHRPPEKADWGTPIWKEKSYPDAYADHPVVCVNWDDAQAYCKWAGLSLPTEAQWEKAARGPGNFKYPWGDEWNEALCRYSGNKGSETTAPVYAYPLGISGYGQYNTSGNVWEWCRDWFGSDYYPSSPKQNPAGPSKGSLRVYRGGSWSAAGLCRSACRGSGAPSYRGDDRGFRVVLAPGQHG